MIEENEGKWRNYQLEKDKAYGGQQQEKNKAQDTSYRLAISAFQTDTVT